MVEDDCFDNRYALTFEQAKKIIADYFFQHFPDFSLTMSESYGMSFLIIYSMGEIGIKIKSERGYLSYDLHINKQTIDLNSFSQKLKYIEVTSQKNIIFVLNEIKIFLQKDNYFK